MKMPVMELQPEKEKLPQQENLDPVLKRLQPLQDAFKPFMEDVDTSRDELRKADTAGNIKQFMTKLAKVITSDLGTDKEDGERRIHSLNSAAVMISPGHAALAEGKKEAFQSMDVEWVEGNNLMGSTEYTVGLDHAKSRGSDLGPIIKKYSAELAALKPEELRELMKHLEEKDAGSPPDLTKELQIIKTKSREPASISPGTPAVKEVAELSAPEEGPQTIDTPTLAQGILKEAGVTGENPEIKREVERMLKSGGLGTDNIIAAKTRAEVLRKGGEKID